MGDGKTRPKGWFSRRHQTDEAHREAVAAYQQKAKPAARIARAARKKQHDLEEALSGKTSD